MTLREAIHEAMAGDGDVAQIWSDGGTDWTLPMYLSEQDVELDDGSSSALDVEAYYDGANRILPIGVDGVIGSVALLTRRAPAA
jgi:hypothetical protein